MIDLTLSEDEKDEEKPLEQLCAEPYGQTLTRARGIGCTRRTRGTNVKAHQEGALSDVTRPSGGTQHEITVQEDIFTLEELIDVDGNSTCATEPLLSLLQGIGKVVPGVLRNKHKIYSILLRARDICNHILSVTDGSAEENMIRPEMTLRAMKQIYEMIDSLELYVPGNHWSLFSDRSCRILLEVAAILTSERSISGPEALLSWPRSRTAFTALLTKLYHAPFDVS